MIDAKAVETARQYFCSVFPNEGVGFVVGGEFIPQDNISPTPEETFELSKAAWLRSGTVRAVMHSHPMKPGEQAVPYPSASDMRNQIASAVPWAVCVCDAERCAEPIWFGDGLEIPPLSGRPFRHGVTDCLSLIRDYYRLEFGTVLPNFARDWEWWDHGQDLYRDGFEHAGFRPVPMHEARPGDVFLASIGRGEWRKQNIPNHGGIYLGGPGEMILHHLTGQLPVDYSRLSAREPGIRYLKYVTHWLRHEAREKD